MEFNNSKCGSPVGEIVVWGDKGSAPNASPVRTLSAVTAKVCVPVRRAVGVGRSEHLGRVGRIDLTCGPLHEERQSARSACVETGSSGCLSWRWNARDVRDGINKFES